MTLTFEVELCCYNKNQRVRYLGARAMVIAFKSCCLDKHSSIALPGLNKLVGKKIISKLFG